MDYVYYTMAAIINGGFIGGYLYYICRYKIQKRWIVFSGFVVPEVLYQLFSIISVSVWHDVEYVGFLYIVKLMIQFAWMYYAEKESYTTFINGELIIYFANTLTAWPFIPLLQRQFGYSLEEIRQLGRGDIKELRDLLIFSALGISCMLLCMLVYYWLCIRHSVLNKVPGLYKEILFLLIVASDIIAATLMKAENFSVRFVMVCITWLAVTFTYLVFLQAVRKRERILLEKKLVRQTMYYRQLSQRQLLLRKMRHDLANHIQIIMNLQHTNREDAAKLYRNQLEDYAAQFSNMENIVVENVNVENSSEKKNKSRNILSEKEKNLAFIRIEVSFIGVLIVYQLLKMVSFVPDYFLYGMIVVILLLVIYATVRLLIKWRKKKIMELQSRIELQEQENQQWKVLQDSVEKEIKESLDTPEKNNPVQLMNLFDSVIAAQTSGNPIIDVMLQSKLINVI